MIDHRPSNPDSSAQGWELQPPAIRPLPAEWRQDILKIAREAATPRALPSNSKDFPGWQWVKRGLSAEWQCLLGLWGTALGALMLLAWTSGVSNRTTTEASPQPIGQLQVQRATLWQLSKSLDAELLPMEPANPVKPSGPRSQLSVRIAPRCV